MIVFCEECGERYSLNMKNMKGNLHSFKCQRCDFLITISKGNPAGIMAPESALLAQIRDQEPENESRPLRVLIVDDSNFSRRMITQILESDGTVAVVGEAVNGSDALEQNEALRPDLITLDVNMPVMGGNMALKRFMLTIPCPVVIISSLSDRSQGAIIDFLRTGAVDFFMKPSSNQEPEKTRQRFIRTIQCAARTKVGNFKYLRAPKPVPTQVKPAGHRGPCRQLAIIFSGAGGYAELFKVFDRLPSGFGGTIVVMQAMPDELTIPLVGYINQICRIPVLPVGPDTQLRAGHCYIGTDNIPLELNKQDDGFYLKPFGTPVTHDSNENCSDLMLRSVAENFPGLLSLTLLSGADPGSLDGLRRFRAKNGKIIIQKPSTCMVSEHVEEIKQAGLADADVVPEEIVEIIAEHLNLPCVALSGNKKNIIGTSFIQQRRFQRIFFTMETGPRVYLSVPGSPTKEFVAVVMNLSEGGLGLVAKESIAPFLKNKDQQIQIKTIKGEPDLSFLAGEKAEVRWVLDTLQVPYRGFGCRFMNIPDSSRQCLREIVGAALQEHHDRLWGEKLEKVTII